MDNNNNDDNGSNTDNPWSCQKEREWVEGSQKIFREVRPKRILQREPQQFLRQYY